MVRFFLAQIQPRVYFSLLANSWNPWGATPSWSPFLHDLVPTSHTAFFVSENTWVPFLPLPLLRMLPWPMYPHPCPLALQILPTLQGAVQVLLSPELSLPSSPFLHLSTLNSYIYWALISKCQALLKYSAYMTLVDPGKNPLRYSNYYPILRKLKFEAKYNIEKVTQWQN